MCLERFCFIGPSAYFENLRYSTNGLLDKKGQPAKPAPTRHLFICLHDDLPLNALQPVSCQGSNLLEERFHYGAVWSGNQQTQSSESISLVHHVHVRLGEGTATVFVGLRAFAGVCREGVCSGWSDGRINGQHVEA